MILSTAYLPPIEYFKKINSAENILIEKCEYFVKQTYRNRCHILGPNGAQVLSIPLINTHEKTLITEKKISYAGNWQQQHWRSITSAYANSPYFIYYCDDLKEFYSTKFELLFDFNTELLLLILKLLKIKTKIKFTEVYQKDISADFRNTISPKSEIEKEDFKSYTQVFSDKHEFEPNLSIVDLIFNKGPEALEYL